MAVSLEASLGSVGGFCAGASFVIDHQVLFLFCKNNFVRKSRILGCK